MNPFDNAIYNFVSAVGKPGYMMFLRVCSSFGSGLVIVTLLLCLYLLFRDKRLFLNFSLISLIALVLSNAIKSIVRRGRPSNILVISYENGYSFPNTPALLSLVFYGFIIYLIFKNVKNKKIRNITSRNISINNSFSIT